MNKKFIAAAMAGTMALSLAACGGSSASTGESTAASTSTDTEVYAGLGDHPKIGEDTLVRDTRETTMATGIHML